MVSAEAGAPVVGRTAPASHVATLLAALLPLVKRRVQFAFMYIHPVYFSLVRFVGRGI